LAKASKKKQFILHRNEVTPQPDTEISGVALMDAKEADQFLHDNKYKGIEKHVKPEMFYYMAGLLKGDKFKCKLRNFSISQFHGVSIDMFLECGFVEASKQDIIRGLVGVGIVALCGKGGVNQKGVDNTTKMISRLTTRTEDNEERLRENMDILDVHGSDKCKVFLRKLVTKHGNNRYGLSIMDYISRSTGRHEPTPKYVKGKNFYIPSMLERCETVTKEPLTDAMYVLDAEKEPYSVSLYMSKRLWGLAFDYKKVYCSTGPMSGVLRAGLLTGLYCLSKWVLAGKMNKNEMDYFMLIREINRYGRDNF
jgi:hypothetical protein